MRDVAERDQDFFDEVRDITEEREDRYGPAAQHFGLTTSLVNLVFGTTFEPHEWAIVMILDKISRESFSIHRDNLLDIAGFASRREQIIREMGDRQLEELHEFVERNRGELEPQPIRRVDHRPHSE